MSQRRAKANSGQRLAPAPWWRTRWGGAIGLAVLAAVGLAAYLALSGGSGSRSDGATPWTTFGTRDVHSLAFDPSDPQHLYFGHHTGLLESRDGGRTWHTTGLTGADAMNVRPGGGSALQIAGHNLFLESADEGQTWSRVPNDLPGLDLHAFVTDPAEPARAWAYAVGFGLFESLDRGRHWTQRQSGDWPVLAVTRVAGTPTLIGLSSRGLGSSTDGGTTWRTLGLPDGQVASLAASPDGMVLFAGTTSGLRRSVDGGHTWQSTAFSGTALTVAVSPTDARIVGLVDDATRFFRSEDGGATWPGPT